MDPEKSLVFPELSVYPLVSRCVDKNEGDLAHGLT